MKVILSFSVLVLFLYACNETPKDPVTFNDYGASTGIPAIDAITQDIKNDPQNMQLYIERCEAYSNDGFYKEAVRDAETVLSLDSTNWRSYRLLAGCYLDNNESRRALKTLEKGTERFPENAYLYLVQAEMNHILQQYDQAIISTEKILKFDRFNVEAYFMQGVILKDMKDTARAINAFQYAVEQDAAHIDSYIELAHIFYHLDKPIAVDYFSNALRIDSMNYTALKGLALYYHQKGNLNDAKTVYKKLIYHHPQEADGSYNFGLLFMEEENWEEALRYFDIATKYSPQFGEAYYFKGYALEELGRLDQAKIAYTNAMNNNDRDNKAAQALDRLTN